MTARYLEGLKTAEIAKREGVQPATVRAHLARGLAALRARLDRRQGGREQWCTVLAPFAAALFGAPASEGMNPPEAGVGDSVPRAMTLPVVGALTVTSISTVAIAAASAVLGTWWWFGRQGPAENLAAPALADSPAIAPASEPITQARRESPVSVPGEALAAGPEAATSMRPRGMVLDAVTGEALTGLDFDLVASDSRVSLVTDAQGRFESRTAIESGNVALQCWFDRGRSVQRMFVRGFQHPFDGPLRVHVGATVAFDLTPPGGLTVDSLWAQITGPGEIRSMGRRRWPAEGSPALGAFSIFRRPA